MEKKLFLALALSLAVLFIFQGTTRKAVPVAPASLAKAAGETVTLGGTTRQKYNPAEILKDNEETVTTGKFCVTFSDVGGSIKSLTLLGYGEKGKSEIFLGKDDPSERPLSIRSGFYDGLDKRRYTKDKGEDYVEYRCVEPNWLEVSKKYTFPKDADYMELTVTVKNASNGRINFSYLITGPAGIAKGSAQNTVEANALVNGKIWKARGAKGGRETKPGVTEWVALKDTYFAAVLKPVDEVKQAVFTEDSLKNLSTGVESFDYSLAPGESKENKYIFYAGPLDEKKLGDISEDMARVVDYGVFGGIAKYMVAALRFLHNATKNWGLAIILITILINLVLFPLTVKSFTSMHKMKKIQPHMQRLKDLHKDNPQRLNKEMMELYKAYNVNPFGGCLPMLLQMPIFIAFYQGLIHSIELRGASFLWAKDLSRPDAVRLPMQAPLIGNHINILPILMIVMMVVQQKISQAATNAEMTEEQRGQQKMMMIMFPLIFGLLFYNMPSGLVLYWLTNTVLMSAEQVLIARQIEERDPTVACLPAGRARQGK